MSNAVEVCFIKVVETCLIVVAGVELIVVAGVNLVPVVVVEAAVVVVLSVVEVTIEGLSVDLKVVNEFVLDALDADVEIVIGNSAALYSPVLVHIERPAMWGFPKSGFRDKSQLARALESATITSAIQLL